MVTTAERMIKMETQMKNLEKAMEEVKTLIKDHITWEENKYVEMDKKYSLKWVERVLIGVLSGGGVALLMGLIYLL